MRNLFLIETVYGKCSPLAHFSGFTSSIALVTYSLVGKLRSFVIALPVAGIFFLMVYAIVMAQRIPGPRVLAIFLLTGSSLGLLRQFSRKSSRDNAVNQ